MAPSLNDLDSHRILIESFHLWSTNLVPSVSYLTARSHLGVVRWETLGTRLMKHFKRIHFRSVWPSTTYNLSNKTLTPLPPTVTILSSYFLGLVLEQTIHIGRIHNTHKEFEIAATLPRSCLPSTRILYENEAFRNQSSNRRRSLAPASVSKWPVIGAFSNFSWVLWTGPTMRSATFSVQSWPTYYWLAIILLKRLASTD